jgi:regulator of protease activity HflC (stomatin/prohibitin superfamily)
MARPKKLELTALMGLVVQGGFLLTCILLSAASGSRAVGALSWYVGVGLLVWFIVLVHGRQRRLAEQEREERERLKATRLSDEIFEETELDTSRASAGLLVFERYLVPGFSVLISGLLIYFAYRILTDVWGQSWVVDKARASHIGVGMAFVSFFGFLIGKYAAGLAQSPGLRLLRAAGGYVLGNVMTALLIAAAMAMYHFDVPWGERVIAYAIPVVMSLVGVEILLNLVLDVYRPRVAGQETRPPYDSRLLGLFAEPGGVLKTVAATLDYQFGFKVSETWFYRFMEQAIIPLLLVQVVSLWLLSCVVVVDQDEVAFMEYLGLPRLTEQDAARGLPASLYTAGIYLKLPWPFAVARHVPAYRVLSLEVGKVHEPRSGPRPDLKAKFGTDIILWGELHIQWQEGYEASFLVPSTATGEEGGPASEPAGGPLPEGAVTGAGTEAPGGGRGFAAGEAKVQAPRVNLARLSAFVHYRVKRKDDGSIDEASAFKYYYQETDITKHVERLAYRAISRLAASEDFLSWISSRRQESVHIFDRMMREAFNQADLGLEVVYVTIPIVHPPAETAGSYEAVVSALEYKQAAVNEAESTAIQLVKSAEAEKAEQLSDAKGFAYRNKILSVAEAQQFQTQLDAFQKAPLVYAFRTYFDTIEQSLFDQKVFVVSVSQNEVQVIDLQEKLQPQLLESLAAMEEMK